MQQCGLGSGVGVVARLLVLAVARPAGVDDPPVLVTPDMHLALPAGEYARGELFDQALIVGAQAREDGHEGLEAGGGDHVGSLPGSRNTGTMILATLALPSRLRRSARPVFWTISTWAQRVSAKQIESMPRVPMVSTPSPDTRTEAKKARCAWRPAASMPLANWHSASRRSLTRRSPHSHADHTRSGATWRPASSS